MEVPCRTIYPWGALGSALTQAEILRRQGYDTPSWENQALDRAAHFLRMLSFNYPGGSPSWYAEGDDLFAPWLLNSMYGHHYVAVRPVKYGKQIGWTDWTHGPRGSTGLPPGGGGGGCPVLEVRAAEGWVTENTILGRSKDGAYLVDAYRVRQVPVAIDGRYRLRIRESEQEVTTLDEVRAIAVDHAPGLRAYATDGVIWLGERRAAFRVRTSAGVDITSLVNGSGPGFLGGPGDTLLVEMTEPGTELGDSRAPGILDPLPKIGRA